MLRSTPCTRVHEAVGACTARVPVRSKANAHPASTAGAFTRVSRRKLLCRSDVNYDASRPPYQAHFAPQRTASATHRSVVQYDYLVLGSGIAGLSYALKVAEYGKVAVLTKDFANEGSTQYAQGGVCAVLDAADSVASHVEDTIVAGGFLNDRNAVEVVCREGPARVHELVKMGAEFTRNQDGSLHLTREGGHTNRRIVHAADLTGKEIERALLATARAHPNISFFEHHMATELVVGEVSGQLHCFGVDVLNQRDSTMTRFLGLSTMLATGGAGQVYPNTTNPHVVTGDGMAMAYRAGASMSNMEFVQFHPTALYSEPSPGGAGTADRTFLITEAVRGEGGMLFNMKGERFMPKYDSRLELAPRDVVARAIQDQMITDGAPHVFLDISHKPGDWILSHFPNIAARCAEQGVDITKDPIPVLPAQHYMCGGVTAGLRGETSIQGLFACGEVSCSGLHGANRLASNSLLEGLVFADRAAGPSVAHAEYAARACRRQVHYAAASADFTGPRAPRALSGSTAEWVVAKRKEVKAMMWECCGIVRRTSALQKAQADLAAQYLEVKAVYKNYGVNTQLVELMNLVTVAELIVSCALQRKESRGLHYSPDYPDMAAEAVPSVITSSLKSRYDLDSVRNNVTVRSSNGFVSLIVPSGGKKSSGSAAAANNAKKSLVRDMSVRSLPDSE